MSVTAQSTDPQTNDRLVLERRRSARTPVASQIGIRRLGGTTFQVKLKDVSIRGCRVEMIEEAEQGEPVIARFPQLEPLGARICWSAATTAGVEFLRTIHPAVFDNLLARLPTD